MDQCQNKSASPAWPVLSTRAILTATPSPIHASQLSTRPGGRKQLLFSVSDNMAFALPRKGMEVSAGRCHPQRWALALKTDRREPTLPFRCLHSDLRRRVLSVQKNPKPEKHVACDTGHAFEAVAPGPRAPPAVKPVQVDPVCPSGPFHSFKILLLSFNAQTKCMEKKKESYVKSLRIFQQEGGLSFDSWQQLEWRHFI